MVGKTISHYKVLEKIGEGGMGEVYLARKKSLESRVPQLTQVIRRFYCVKS